MKRWLHYLLLIGVFSSFTRLAAAQEITGTVTDTENGTTLPGVNVLLKNTTIGTVTDIDGKYRIDANDENATLVFSSVGYEPQEVAVEGRSTVDVALASDVTALNEVVVTSFGIKRDKKALGYAVQELTSEEITETQQPNVVNALRGKVAGVNIYSPGRALSSGGHCLW